MKFLQRIGFQSMPSKLKSACLISLGAFSGMAVYVANISQAASYLSDDPEACINCHIMTPQYASWQHSSHARVASCNDCHVPHDSVLRKYYFKAMDGGRHSAMFTLRMEPQVIKAREESVKVIQANCMRCHTDQVHGATTEAAFSRNCTECHREVPHGRVNSLSSTPNAAVPEQRSVIPDWMRALKNSQETQDK
ncbi:MAG: cytochrome c nitrite reductase small subunit [Chthonomonas sp.]|nr:cytochrome c nitrite reductase small subunit [Chthonomonas sp.]